MGAPFGADASKVAHKNDDDNGNNNINNNGRANKDLVSTLFCDFVFCVNSEKTSDVIYTAAEASNPQGNGRCTRSV